MVRSFIVTLPREKAPDNNRGLSAEPRSGLLRSVDVLRKGLLGRGDDGRESLGVLDRHFGELPTVDLDSREGQTLDETVVGQPFGAGGGIDPGDPQLAEFALAGLAVTVVVYE